MADVIDYNGFEVEVGSPLYDRLCKEVEGFDAGAEPRRDSVEAGDASSLTKKEITALLDEQGIDYNPKATKDELLALLAEGPEGDTLE